MFILAAGNDLIRCTINRPILDYAEEPSDFLVMNDLHMPLAARPRDDLSNIKIVAQNDYLPYRQVRMLALPDFLVLHLSISIMFKTQTCCIKTYFV